MSDRKYSEGICADGAAILRDGEMMRVHEIVAALNGLEAEVKRLRADKQRWRDLARNAFREWNNAENFAMGAISKALIEEEEDAARKVR